MESQAYNSFPFQMNNVSLFIRAMFSWWATIVKYRAALICIVTCCLAWYRKLFEGHAVSFAMGEARVFQRRRSVEARENRGERLSLDLLALLHMDRRGRIWCSVFSKSSALSSWLMSFDSCENPKPSSHGLLWCKESNPWLSYPKRSGCHDSIVVNNSHFCHTHQDMLSL